MRRVIVESPFAGDVEANVEYARRCVRDSVLRGEAPIASHLLFTQPGILDDDVPAERQLGIDAGLAWRAVAEASVVYTDRGISRGMEYGIAAAKASGLPVEFRSIDSEQEGAMAEPTEAQLLAGARAYDRAGLRSQGWSENEIERAMEGCRPSDIGMKMAGIVLSAALAESR